MSQMFCRERRSWTAKEDQLLRDAVQKEDPDNANPSKWHAIAKHVPNRTNKDCRKRWFAKMASDVVKGGWAPDEDEKLVKGIERYGTRWSLVASVVQTRNSDQCAKRWTDTLNPAIDRTTWSSEADELLLRAVSEHGKVWTKIVKTYFPGRTGLSAKNRYNSITRFNSDLSRSTRPRRKSDGASYALGGGGGGHHRKTESVSSSSSASPESPSMTLPYITTSFQGGLDPKQPTPYRFSEPAFTWSSSSSSVTSDDVPSASFRGSPIGFDFMHDHHPHHDHHSQHHAHHAHGPTSPSPSDADPASYHAHAFDIAALSAFADPHMVVFPDTPEPGVGVPAHLYKTSFPAHGGLAAAYAAYGAAAPDQYSIFDGLATSLDAGAGISVPQWEAGAGAGVKSSVNSANNNNNNNNIGGGYKMPTPSEFYVF